ncbi:MAG: 3-oxoacyl-[acyl-carrier-protein] reductase [Pseudomonadota bacterium]
MFDLTGKTALVTGATGGIGEAIARCLHGAGATVALSGTREAVLQDRANGLGERAIPIVANLSEPDEAERLGEAAEEALGQVDILVNNAGVTRDNLFIRMKDEEWDQVIAVNLSAVFRLTRTISKTMMRRRSGRIVNITSVVGVSGNPGQANYCAAKAGMIGMSKSLALETARRGITVNCIAPGFIETPMTDKLGAKIKEQILERVPAGKLGSVDDIAAAALYLASDEAAYMTGQTLHVNGGMLMV